MFIGFNLLQQICISRVEGKNQFIDWLVCVCLFVSMLLYNNICTPGKSLSLSLSLSTLGQDKYIHSFTSCDGAYGGSLSAVLSVATHSGWLNQKLIFDATKTLSLLQTYPSMMWLMPWEQVNKKEEEEEE